MDAEQDLEVERHENEVCLDRNLFGFKADLSLKREIFKNVTKAWIFGSTENKTYMKLTILQKKLQLRKNIWIALLVRFCPGMRHERSIIEFILLKIENLKRCLRLMIIFTVIVIIIIDLISSCPGMFLALQPLPQ